MALKTIDYLLLEEITSVEEFLKSQFNCSSSRLKKYFDKKFLTRSLKAQSALQLPLNFVNDGEISPCYVGEALAVIYEDEMFLVLDKRPNQFVHPLCYDEGNNCLSFIRQSYPHLLKVNHLRMDRGLLYRLDYETSGVLIYVKDGPLFFVLRKEFNQIAKEKTYRCWVLGDCQLDGKFQNSFSTSGPKGEKVLVAELETYPLKGSLHLKRLRYDNGRRATLMSVELETGLRHQIRAQMAFLGHPLIGDVFYGGGAAERLYLHALTYRLKFNDKDLEFTTISNDFI